jgi:cobalt-zinc-cadmium resistance protein CzcA
MTKEKLVAELQEKFAREFPGVGFNFSQYIQDNVQEACRASRGPTR